MHCTSDASEAAARRTRTCLPYQFQCSQVCLLTRREAGCVARVTLPSACHSAVARCSPCAACVSSESGGQGTVNGRARAQTSRRPGEGRRPGGKVRPFADFPCPCSLRCALVSLEGRRAPRIIMRIAQGGKIRATLLGNALSATRSLALARVAPWVKTYRTCRAVPTAPHTYIQACPGSCTASCPLRRARSLMALVCIPVGCTWQLLGVSAVVDEAVTGPASVPARLGGGGRSSLVVKGFSVVFGSACRSAPAELSANMQTSHRTDISTSCPRPLLAVCASYAS